MAVRSIGVQGKLFVRFTQTVGIEHVLATCCLTDSTGTQECADSLSCPAALCGSQHSSQHAHWQWRPPGSAGCGAPAEGMPARS